MSNVQITTEGKVFWIGEIEKFTSHAGKDYTIQGVVFTDDTDEKKRYYFKLFGQFQDKIAGLKVGDHCRIGWSSNSFEWKGRWYTDMALWECEKLEEPKVEAPKPTAKKDSTLPPEFGDDLPF